MKKNWFQILSLALNAVLLIALLMTRAELVDTQTILKSQLDGIAWRLSDMDERITNLSAKQREQTEDLSDFSFEPTGLDPESHTLQADMSITLRRWTADTEVTLVVTQNGQTTELPMSGSGGVFTAPVNLARWNRPAKCPSRRISPPAVRPAGRRSPVTVTLPCCCP